METQRLKSKLLMYALELVAHKIKIDPNVLVKWLEGYTTLQPVILNNIEKLTTDVDGLYYEVVQDPLATEAAQRLLQLLESLNQSVSQIVIWWQPYAIRETANGVCILNRFGLPITPTIPNKAYLYKFMKFDITNLREVSPI